MRKFSVLMVAAMLLATGSIFANDSKKNSKKADPSKSLSTQIADLLDDNSFVLEKGDWTANVKFILNNDKEIVVLSVDTDNEVLEGFVKSRLNYKKVENAAYKEGRAFTIPVRITEG